MKRRNADDGVIYIIGVRTEAGAEGDNDDEEKRENCSRPELTRTACFRITESQFQNFHDLLRIVPGSEAGSMYREIFARGLKDLEIYYDKHLNLTCAEVAAEVVEGDAP